MFLLKKNFTYKYFIKDTKKDYVSSSKSEKFSKLQNEANNFCNQSTKDIKNNENLELAKHVSILSQRRPIIYDAGQRNNDDLELDDDAMDELEEEDLPKRSVLCFFLFLDFF